MRISINHDRITAIHMHSPDLSGAIRLSLQQKLVDFWTSCKGNSDTLINWHSNKRLATEMFALPHLTHRTSGQLT